MTTIIRIVAEGTKVKKGDVVCELDSARLKDQLVNQRMTTASANAANENSKRMREIAELAVVEYADGILKQDLNTLKSEISAARSAIQKTESRLERTRRVREQLNGLQPRNGAAKSRDEIMVDLDLEDRLEEAEQRLLRDRMAFELATTKLELLQKYSQSKTIKSLQVEVERNRSDELAKRAKWKLEKSKEAKLERQIAACTLVAPVDGLVVYGKAPGQFADQAQIEEGATVRLRWKVVTIHDLSRIQVLVKLPESHVDQIAPNMIARIRVDAFPDQLFTGIVRDVAPRADRSNFS
ncbi:MAG TPA: efflux RND transporter periplasmic adaptor subunit, partial [Isosphaeraceae bacterium]|nr:efflux RND transporter periplasmic adaptor subunit [Isosphaeraceae bacterium]